MRTFRAYFNRHREVPQICSIDAGTQDSEINVIGFRAGYGCVIESHYNGEKANTDTPSFWITIEALGFSVTNGIVYFIGEPSAHSQLP